MNNSKLWTKDFIIITATSFLVFLTFYLLMTTLTLYSIEQFKASETEAGFTASIFVVGSFVLRIFTGKYIDVFGRRKLIYSSLTLFLLATLSYFIADSFTSLLIVRFIHGAAFGIATTVMATAVMSIIPPDRRGEGTGYFSLSTPLATAIGPFLGIIITQYADFDMIFIVCTAFSAISIFVMLFATIENVALTQTQRNDMKGFKFKDFFEKSSLPLGLIIFLLGIAYSSVLTFISPYSIEINLVEAASFFFIVYAFALLISRPFTGKLLDRKGENIVIYPSLVAFAIGLICLSQSYSSWMMLVAGGLIALGFGNMLSSSQVAVINRAPKHRIGLATSTFYVSLDAGIGFGPLFLGAIIGAFGFRSMYMAMAVLAIVSIILYYFLHGRYTKKEATVS